MDSLIKFFRIKIRVWASYSTWTSLIVSSLVRLCPILCVSSTLIYLTSLPQQTPKWTLEIPPIQVPYESPFMNLFYLKKHGLLLGLNILLLSLWAALRFLKWSLFLCGSCKTTLCAYRSYKREQCFLICSVKWFYSVLFSDIVCIFESFYWCNE